MHKVFLTGPAGRIEGRYTQSKNHTSPVALILPPQPLHVGTINNSVEHNLFNILAQRNFTVLRINFREASDTTDKLSEDIHAATHAATTDAATALDWLQQNNQAASSHIIVGLSFGAWITMQLMMRRPEIMYFISIAPPVNKYDFSFLSPCPVPGLIIQGNKDSVVDEFSVSELANRLMKQKNINVDYRVIQGADHFFRNKMQVLSDEINDYLDDVFADSIKHAMNNYPNLKHKSADINNAIPAKRRKKANIDDTKGKNQKKMFLA